MDIGTLVTTLKLDHGKFAADLKTSSRNVNSFAAKSNRSLARAQKGWKDITGKVKAFGAVAASVAAVGGGVYLLTKRALDFADTIAKTADKIGLSTDALQEYRYIADRAGVATSMLDNGLVAFSKRIGELKQGTGALSTYLKKLDENFARQVASAGSVDEALRLVFNRMKEMTSASDRAALGAAAFSRSAGVAMTNMANSAEELRKRAHHLGIVIDESLLRNSEQTIDAITDLDYVLKANLNRTLVSLAPTIGQISTDMAEWTASNQEFIQVNLPEYLSDVVWGLKQVSGPLTEVMGIYLKYLPNIYSISRLIRSLTEEAKDLSSVTLPMPNVPPLPDTPDSAGFDATQYKKYLDELTNKQTDFEFKARQLDRDTWEQRRQEVYRWAEDYRKVLKDIEDKTAKMKLQGFDTTEAQAQITALKNQIVSTSATELKFINKEHFISDIEDMTSKAERFANTFQDSLVELMTQGEINFKSLANSFVAMIADMIVEAEKLKFLEGFKSGASKEGGSWISGITSGIMNMFDSGGWIREPVIGIGTRSGESYSFAEKGPEFVNARGSGGSVSMEINIENNTGSNIESDNVGSSWDGERGILNIVLNATKQNKYGFKNNMTGALSR